MNILVATPGRLLQHMDETPYFDCTSLSMLVLDEADRVLDMARPMRSRQPPPA
jgi:ATP-dependent RNA helicase DDX10/DBP4